MTEKLGDEVLVYCGATQAAHALSRDAASVWRECDGRTSATAIARRVGLDEATVSRALEELSAVQLIEKPEGLSRREASKRVAKLGAAALSAPLIYSVAIPANAAATLCTANCPGGAVIPCGPSTCGASPGQLFLGDACSSGDCYRGATNNTCYCVASACVFVGDPCVVDQDCCAQSCVSGFCAQ